MLLIATAAELVLAHVHIACMPLMVFCFCVTSNRQHSLFTSLGNLVALLLHDINPFTDSNEFIRSRLQLNSGRQRIYSFSKSNGKKRLLYTNNWTKNDVNGVVVTTIYK